MSYEIRKEMKNAFETLCLNLSQRYEEEKREALDVDDRYSAQKLQTAIDVMRHMRLILTNGWGTPLDGFIFWDKEREVRDKYVDDYIDELNNTVKIKKNTNVIIVRDYVDIHTMLMSNFKEAQDELKRVSFTENADRSRITNYIDKLKNDIKFICERIDEVL